MNWRNVDVRGADGLLHLGSVIDCDEEGLLIELGCATGAQLVPFGQIYHSGPGLDHFYIAQSQDLPVDALIRRSYKESATWYPGILLTGHYDFFRSFALVRITTPNGRVLELIPGTHLRAQHSDLNQFLVEKGQYVKEEMQLPRGVASGSPSSQPYTSPPGDQRVVDCFNQNCLDERVRAAATHTDGGVLHVLKTTRDPWATEGDYPVSTCSKLQDEKLLRILGVTCATVRTRQKRSLEGDDSSVFCRMYQTLKKICTRAVSLFGTSIDHAMDQSLASNCILDSPSENLWDVGSIETSSSVIMTLPKELLAEIFGFLDGTVQTQLRRVCCKWSDFLNTSYVLRVLLLPKEDDVSIPGVCLLKCWTNRTKIIVNTIVESARTRWKDGHYYRTLMGSGRLFPVIMQEHQLPRLETLILANISWECSDWKWPSSNPYSPRRSYFGALVNHICQELNCFASVCRGLVLKNVTVTLSAAFFQRYRFRVETCIIMRITNGRIEGQLSVEDWWNRMDSSLPTLTAADVDRWNHAVNGGWDVHMAVELVQILNECQSADPRSGNQLYGMEWSQEDLAGLDLTKLNRITGHRLLKTSANEKLVLVLDW